jgi:uncharacterized protein YbjT (DUF2867 family)
MAAERKALIVGSTGLIGSELLDLLLESELYHKVYSIGRRNSGKKHNKLEEIKTDFSQLEGLENFFRVDDVFCCLGTTMKKAGSKDAFLKVDYEYPMAIAKKALENGAERFFLVSSLGANPKSLMFYSKVKGRLEDELKALPFKSLLIFRPSLLLGNRNERRIGEDLGKAISKLIPYVGPMRKYKPIMGRQVAQAMLNVAAKKTEGTQIYESSNLQNY